MDVVEFRMSELQQSTLLYVISAVETVSAQKLPPGTEIEAAV